MRRPVAAFDAYLVRAPTNRDVVERFLDGKRAMTRNLTTDGEHLFSYMLPVARRRFQGRLEVDLLLGTYVSKTTSMHIGLLRQVASGRGVPVTMLN